MLNRSRNYCGNIARVVQFKRKKHPGKREKAAPAHVRIKGAAALQKKYICRGAIGGAEGLADSKQFHTQLEI